jgi:hypothetical protein
LHLVIGGRCGTVRFNPAQTGQYRKRMQEAAMPRYFLSPRVRAAALGLLATAAAVPLVVAPQVPAAAAPTRPAGTGFGRAIEIALPRNAAKAVNSILLGVACSGRGYCSAGGSYNDSRGNSQALVVTESGGKWGRAVEVKLPRNAASDPFAEVNGVACSSLGNCVAVGYYSPTASEDAGFIVTQRRGTWGRAIAATPLPKGTTASWLYAVACPAPGSCEAVGSFLAHSTDEGIVLEQAHGRWTQERTLRAPVGEGPDLQGVACTRAGDCVADGFYFPTGVENVYRAVGYVESRGRWGRAKTVGAPKDATFGLAALTSAGCAPRGSCLGAGVDVVGTTGYGVAAAESGGRWRAATEIRALPPHATGADLDGVSCASSKLCVAAGGYYTSASEVAYLVSFVSGRWRDAGGVSLPSNAASPNRGFFYAVGCASDGYCAAAGYYDYYLSTNIDRGFPMVAIRS